MGRLDLMLINPGTWADVYSQVGSLSGIAPPVGLGLVAAFVREKGFSVAILDAEAEGLSPSRVADAVRDGNPRLAGVTAVTAKMTAADRIIRAIREKAPGVRTIIGGHHAAALPERTLLETGVDLVCNGEGLFPTAGVLDLLRGDPGAAEFPVPGIVYRKGDETVFNEPPGLIRNLDDLPFAAWDLLPMSRYRAHNWHCFGRAGRTPYAVVFTSLGCPFSCTYCSVNAVYGGSGFRTRSPAHFVSEIDLLVGRYGVRHMEIVDDTFTVNRKRVHEICDLLIERGYDLNLWAYARTDTVDPALLAKMKKAGINWVAYGFESGNEDVRRGVNKGQRSIGETVGMTNEAGLNIIANFMFGLPDDDLDSMRQTLDLALRINAEYANFWSAMAFPGSALHGMAVEAGWPLPDVWHGYSQYAYETLPLPTRHLSSADVLAFRDAAFLEYFGNPEYQDKIGRKFGQAALEEVRGMLGKRLKRKHVHDHGSAAS